jgi:hypothetical protein
MGEQLSGTAVPVWLLAGVVAAAALLLIAALVVRLLFLSRGSGTLRCILRSAGDERPGPWRAGWGRYGTEELEWYPSRSLRVRPAVRLPRQGLRIVKRDVPENPRLRRSATDAVVVDVAVPSTSNGLAPQVATHSLVMSERALTGFLSWLEAAPPGPRYHR